MADRKATDIKAGDVVRLNPEDFAGWLGILELDHPYVVYKTKRSHGGEYLCCSLKELSGEVVAIEDFLEPPWSCWLVRDPFLSAVHQRHRKRHAQPV